MTHKLAMKMQAGKLVVYSQPGKPPLTGIQKMQIEQEYTRRFWEELEKKR